MYILLEDNDFLYFVDQHALAERIAYEKMKQYETTAATYQLLQPVSVQISPHFTNTQYEEILQSLGFDVSLLSETQLVVYAVPQFFADYADDIEKIVRIIMTIDNPSYDTISDAMYAQKACKASIKA